MEFPGVSIWQLNSVFFLFLTAEYAKYAEKQGHRSVVRCLVVRGPWSRCPSSIFYRLSPLAIVSADGRDALSYSAARPALTNFVPFAPFRGLPDPIIRGQHFVSVPSGLVSISG